MNQVQPELVRLMCAYMKPHEQLLFSTCAKESPLFSCPKEIREKNVVKIRFNMLKPFIVPCNENPLFGDNEDLQEFINELYDVSDKERIEFTFSHLSYYVDAILSHYHYSTFHKSPYPRGFFSHGFCVEKHATSSKPWDHPLDSSVVQKDVCISAIYRVKIKSFLMRRIRRSLCLKALVG
tara:strand:- start:588 stop:1127 length:540 start_codon:yes stop_codon:yes gene_type:complete